MFDLNKGWHKIDKDTEEKFIGATRFVKPINSDHCSTFCPVCDIAIATIEDVKVMKKENCCEDCYNTYYFLNKEKWESGWRPNINNT